jgi:4-diphosphocytidyl-2-C-methyl-D-erythritol kinase
MGGIGDKLFDYDLDLSNYLILIVKPNFSISTKSVYKNLNLELTNKFKSINRAPSQISEFFNDLENAVLIKYPEINYIKNMLYKGGAFFSLMTGSGSAVFGLFKEHNEALHCLEQIKNRYYKIFLTKTLV